MTTPKKTTKPKPDEATTILAADVRTALRGQEIRDKSPVELAQYRMDELDTALAAHRRAEAEKAEAFKALLTLAGRYGLTVDAGVTTLPALIELIAKAIAALDEKLNEACEILGIWPESKRGVEAMLTALREMEAGHARRIEELHREIVDTRKILGIDDPDGLLLDEHGVLTGDMMAAWELVNQTVWEGLHTRPDNLPDACRKLVQLVTEQRDRMRGAVGNLALHTSCTEIEDATLDVREKLEATEDRLEALENERLQFLADTHPGDNDEALRILLALMHRVATGKVSIMHRC